MIILRHLEKNIENKEKPIVVNNIVVNNYLSFVRMKTNNNQKNSFVNYLILLSFYFIIIIEITCVFIDEKDLKTRLYVFDLTLFFGGVRRYTSYVMILAWSGASMLFKSLHMTRNNRLMKWIEIFEYINGTKSLEIFNLPILRPADEKLLKYWFKINIKCATITMSIICKHKYTEPGSNSLYS